MVAIKNFSPLPGLYIHVPFCVKKCLYCGFYSVTDLGLTGAYVEALLREMELGAKRTGFRCFDTIYFGGGTPSLLSPLQVKALLDRAALLFGLGADISITLEANPKTVSRQTLEGYRKAGINRINFGIQSFCDENLKFLGRIHNSEDAKRALADARIAGFDDLGLDLIFGLPGQSPETWKNDLTEALGFLPEHLSCYMLTIEENTPFGQMREKGRDVSADDGEMAGLFMVCHEFLAEAGYIHYEISNYAISPKFMSRHNRKYWSGAPYLGLGPCAHSFDGMFRSWNVASLDEYLNRMGQGWPAEDGRESLSPRDRIIEALFLGLRQSAGIGIGAFAAKTGLDFFGVFGKAFEKCEKAGWLTFSDGRVAPTPNGMLYSDGMTKLFMSHYD